jgi:hypothetical protein
MTFEGGMLLLLAYMFTVPLLLVIARLVGWLTGTKSKPVWLVMALAVTFPLALTLWLDFGGVIRPVRVVDKTEVVKLDYKGSWTRSITVGAEYDDPRETIPVRFSLGCDPQTFDALQVGQTVEVRMLEFGEVFKFARLNNRSTLSALTGLFPREPRGPWRAATAVVRDVRHITEHRGRRHRSPLRWPYDVVELVYTPEGRSEPVIAVDRVEAASVPALSEGSHVKILWPADDPREARIAGARPGAPLANWLYDFGETLAIVGVLIALVIAWETFRRRRKKRRALPG